MIPKNGQRICLGTYLLKGDKDEAMALRYAINSGVRYIDTAEHYGNGEVESWLGYEIKSDCAIISKVHPKNWRDISGACESSLRRLKRDSLDLYLLHWKTPDIDLSSVVDQFIRLTDQGKIKQWGVSNFSDRDLAQLESKPYANQLENNLLCWYPDVMRYMNDKDIKMIGHSVLGGGKLLSDKIYMNYCHKNSLSPVGLAVSWALKKNCLPIIKVSSIKHFLDAIYEEDVEAHQRFLTAMENKHARIQLEQ